MEKKKISILGGSNQLHLEPNRWLVVGKQDKVYQKSSNSPNQKRKKFTPTKSISPLRIQKDSKNFINKLIDKHTQGLKTNQRSELVPPLNLNKKENGSNLYKNQKQQSLSLNSGRSLFNSKSIVLNKFKGDQKASEISRITYKDRIFDTDYIISNDTKRDICGILNIGYPKMILFDKVQNFKIQLQSFKKNIIQQIITLKQYSIRAVLKITQQYSKHLQILHKKDEKLIIQKFYKRSHQTNQNIKNRQANNIKTSLQVSNGTQQYFHQQKLNKKHQRINTEQLQFYKSDRFFKSQIPIFGLKNERISLLSKHLSQNGNEKQLRQLKQQQQKTIRARSFQKIFETIEKLKTTIISEENKLLQCENKQVSLQKITEKQKILKKKKTILKKNSKFSSHSIEAQQNIPKE